MLCPGDRQSSGNMSLVLSVYLFLLLNLRYHLINNNTSLLNADLITSHADRIIIYISWYFILRVGSAVKLHSATSTLLQDR